MLYIVSYSPKKEYRKGLNFLIETVSANSAAEAVKKSKHNLRPESSREKTFEYCKPVAVRCIAGLEFTL